MDIGSALDAYLNHREALAKLGAGRVQTVAGLRRRARSILAAMDHGDEIDEAMKRSRLELFVAERLHSGIAATTIRQDISLLKSLLAWARDEGVTDHVVRFPTVRAPNTEDELPPLRLITALIAKLPERHADACLFMLATGLSPHELERLGPEDFDLERGVVRIGKRADFFVKVEARRRDVPLNALAMESAERVGYHFPSREATAKQLQRVQPKGSRVLTPKVLRSMFASIAASQVPEHVLQPLLGHAPGSPVTRRHYVRSGTKERAAAIAAVGKAIAAAG